MRHPRVTAQYRAFTSPSVQPRDPNPRIEKANVSHLFTGLGLGLAK